MTIPGALVWLNDSAVASAIRESLWLFPAIQIVHLLALATLGGAVLVVDLRLLGVGLRGVPAATLGRDLTSVLGWSLVIITLSGIGMFASDAERLADNGIFRLKVAAFIVAVAFTVFVRPRWLRPGHELPRGARAVALVSISLWFTVAAAGRGVGFW